MRVVVWLLFFRIASSEEVLEALFGKTRGTGSTPLISVANLTASIGGWTGSDLAVFYYSPYGDAGKFSRQVLPLWDEVWRWHQKKKTKRLAIRKFNCEASVTAQQLCYEVGVKQYPTLTFYGYSRLSFHRAPLHRSTSYRGLALSEAIRDWTVAMHMISWVQRTSDRILFFLGLKPAPETVQLLALQERQAEKQLDYERRLQKAQADLQKANDLLRKYQVPSSTSESGSGVLDDLDQTASWDDILANLADLAGPDRRTVASSSASSSSSSSSGSSSSTADDSVVKKKNSNNNNAPKTKQRP